MACLRTYSTLRIISSVYSPDEISKMLCIEPTRTRPRDIKAKYRHEREKHAWFFETRENIQSTNSEDHIQYIVSTFSEKVKEFQKLEKEGCFLNIFSFWAGNGQGGPLLSPELLAKLGELRFSVSWDNYFEEDNET